MRKQPWTIPLACVLIALVRRGSGWDPPSLWADDQWLALAIRNSNLERLCQLHLPSPLGFSALVKLTSGVASDREWPLQIWPFAVGLATIPAFYLVVRRVAHRPIALALACLLVTCHPVAERYATRVKHYTFDLLLVIVLLGLFIALLQRPSRLGFAGFVIVAWIAPLFSFASLFVSVAGVHALCLDRWLRAREPPGAARETQAYVAGALLFDLGILLLYYSLLADNSNPAMKAFWIKYFLRFDSLESAFSFVTLRVLGIPLHAISPWFGVLLWPLYIGIRSTLRDSLLRPVVWLTGLVLVEQLAAAVLQLYPIGDARTSLFSYPLFWLLTAIGLDRWADSTDTHKSQRLLRALVAASVVLAALCRPRVEYSKVRDRQAVERTLRVLQPTDGLLMLPFGLLALAYYGERPVELIATSRVAYNFEAWPDYPNLFVLPLQVGGVSVRAQPELIRTPLEPLYRRDHRRLLFLSTHATPALDESILRDAEQHGYHRTQTYRASRRATVYMLVRDTPPR